MRARPQITHQAPEFACSGIRYKYLDQTLALIKGCQDCKPVIALKDKSEIGDTFRADQEKIFTQAGSGRKTGCRAIL
jgi:hypothetical protein